MHCFKIAGKLAEPAVFEADDTRSKLVNSLGR